MTSATLRASRSRFKALRLNEQVESPAEHADKLVAILESAAESDPAPASRAYRQWVETRAFDRFMELCRSTPVRARRP